MQRASRMIDAHCRRRFHDGGADATRYYDAVGPHIVNRTLRLDEDLISITTLTNGNSSAITSTYYVLEPYSGPPYWAITLKSNAGLSWTYSGALEKCISVAGRWGYCAQLAEPDDVAQACIRLSAMMYRQKETTAPIDRVEVSPEGVPLLPGGLPRDVREILKPYVRML